MERKRNSSTNETQLKQSIEDAVQRLSDLVSEKELAERAFASVEAEVTSLKEGLTKKQNQFRHYNENIEEVIESYKSDYIEKLNQQASAKNELQYLQQQLDQQSNRSSRLEAENEKYVTQREELHARHKERAKELQEQKSRLMSMCSFIVKNKKLEQIRAQYEKQEKTLYQAYQFLQQAKSRKEMLEEMEEDYSGFFQG